MTTQELWSATLGELELTLSKANFTTWFKNTSIVRYEDGKAVIGVPNAFTKMWLENKYHQPVLHALQRVTKNSTLAVVYEIISTRETEKRAPHPNQLWRDEQPHAPQGVSDRSPSYTNGLSPKYTFENFIVGKTNELAHAACLAVAARPGDTYNPLFLYGGSGLGKTHLLCALGNEVQKRAPTKRVLYVSSERFTNDFIHAVQQGTVEQFKTQYRTVDVLLIDDIQFLAGKEGTQEEFFHTFNALHQANKQIVVSSDRAPKAIPALERRLVSRFEWGMIADVSSPDFETRIAILSAKAKEKGASLSREILHAIATAVQNNVRELEGALNRVIAAQDLKKGGMDVTDVREILTSLTQGGSKRSITPRVIVHTVADFFDVKIEDIIGESRRKELVYPRQVTMYLMREDGKCSYPTIGNEIGKRDHTTAIHACEKITRQLTQNERLKEEVSLIRERLYNNAKVV